MVNAFHYVCIFKFRFPSEFYIHCRHNPWATRHIKKNWRQQKRFVANSGENLAWEPIFKPFYIYVHQTTTMIESPDPIILPDGSLPSTRNIPDVMNGLIAVLSDR